MSDTPQTDKATIKGVVPQWSSTPLDMVHADFARGLERELNRMTKARDTLQDTLNEFMKEVTKSKSPKLGLTLEPLPDGALGTYRRPR